MLINSQQLGAHDRAEDMLVLPRARPGVRAPALILETVGHLTGGDFARQRFGPAVCERPVRDVGPDGGERPEVTA